MKTTTAVILVAGIGSRLRPLTDDRPKALVDVGGETILGRAVRLLARYGVTRVVLATGYREDAVQNALQNAPIQIEYCRNPAYDRTQNAVSLALCAGRVPGAFFKLDGDVVFAEQVLARLDASLAPLAVAVDAGRMLDAEAMKVRASGSSILAFGKQIDLAESAGESIGIERIADSARSAVFAGLERARSEGRTHLYYEDVYSELIACGELVAEAVPVHDLAWTEVDDVTDLERARALIRDGL